MHAAQLQPTEPVTAKIRLDASRPLPGMVGNSVGMRQVFALARRAAACDASVLITGESGSGKDVLARALHDHSGRRKGPFRAVNCAALAPQLLESELFGHVRGAFTGAEKSRPGLLLSADGGTLFLDELGEMPLSLQPKLLRFLEDRKVRPVGGDSDCEVDVRVIAATNRDVEQAVQEGRLRADLYYRLDVIHLKTPPLRERGQDILDLAEQFLRDHGSLRLDDEAKTCLLRHSWPGNVRELRNCIQRAATLCERETVSVQDLPASVRDQVRRRRATLAVGDLVSIEQIEQRHISLVLEQVGGNKSAAAKVLGVDRKTLHRKLARRDQP